MLSAGIRSCDRPAGAGVAHFRASVAFARWSSSASHAGKPPIERAAAEDVAELALDEARHPGAVGGLGCLRQEALEVRAHDVVEHRPRRRTWLVDPRQHAGAQPMPCRRSDGQGASASRPRGGRARRPRGTPGETGCSGSVCRAGSRSSGSSTSRAYRCSSRSFRTSRLRWPRAGHVCRAGFCRPRHGVRTIHRTPHPRVRFRPETESRVGFTRTPAAGAPPRTRPAARRAAPPRSGRGGRRPAGGASRRRGSRE